MNPIHRIGRPLLLAFALVIAGAAAAQDYSLFEYRGADRDAKLLAAAKKEGTLMLYTSLAEKNLRSLIDPFEKKYGIKVNIWRGGTSRVLQRTLSEGKAGRNQVDAIHFGAPELEALHREKALRPVWSPRFAELIDGAVPDHREWAATILQVYVQAYNTGLVKKEDLPKTYEDLLDPKWKGKLGIEEESWVWYATLVQDMGEAKGQKLFRDIAARNGLSARYGFSLLTNMVAAGEVPLSLTVYSHMPVAAKAKGASIDWFTLDPTIARANGIGIARRAPHPNAALLFYEYLLRADEGQRAFASIDYVPTNTKLPSPMPGRRIKLVDPVLALDQVQKWQGQFDRIIKGNGR